MPIFRINNKFYMEKYFRINIEWKAYLCTTKLNKKFDAARRETRISFIKNRWLLRVKIYTYNFVYIQLKKKMIPNFWNENPIINIVYIFQIIISRKFIENNRMEIFSRSVAMDSKVWVSGYQRIGVSYIKTDIRGCPRGSRGFSTALRLAR